MEDSKKARENDIKVICGNNDSLYVLDSAVQDELIKTRAQVRAATMNYFAKEEIKRQQPGEGNKFVILVGKAHVNTHEGFKNKIPGLAQLLNVPSIEIDNKGNIVLFDGERTITIEKGQR